LPYPFPRRSEVPILEKQGFDDLIDFLDREFQKFPDHRAGNALRYDLANVLKNAFAMFSLKAPSLIDFKKRTEPERNNCGKTIPRASLLGPEEINSFIASPSY
jgi:hypothetical protein